MINRECLIAHELIYEAIDFSIMLLMTKLHHVLHPHTGIKLFIIKYYYFTTVLLLFQHGHAHQDHNNLHDNVSRNAVGQQLKDPLSYFCYPAQNFI